MVATYPDYKSLALWLSLAFDPTADHTSGHATIQLILFGCLSSQLLRCSSEMRDEVPFDRVRFDDAKMVGRHQR